MSHPLNYVPTKKAKTEALNLRMDEETLALIHNLRRYERMDKSEYTRYATLVGSYALARAHGLDDVALAIQSKLHDYLLGPINPLRLVKPTPRTKQ